MESKFTIPVLASILILGAFTVGYSIDDAFAKGQGQPKVTICHVDQDTGEKETITVSNKAVDKHKEKHGDELGECITEPEPPNECPDGEELVDGNCVPISPEPPAPFCGDGVVNQASEQCDDGNNANGDGCSSTCELEAAIDLVVTCISGCSVDSVGDIVSLQYTVTNTGATSLTNVVLVEDNGTPGNMGDDFNPPFTGGDTNNNSELDVVEIWTYNSQIAMTQAIIDAGEDLVFTSTVDSTETDPPVQDDVTITVLAP